MSKCQQKQFKIFGLKEDSSHIHDQLSNDEIEKKKGQKSQEQNLRIKNLKMNIDLFPKMKKKNIFFHSRFSISSSGWTERWVIINKVY